MRLAVMQRTFVAILPAKLRSRKALPHLASATVAARYLHSADASGKKQARKRRLGLLPPGAKGLAKSVAASVSVHEARGAKSRGISRPAGAIVRRT
jgi:hypothetical protein